MLHVIATVELVDGGREPFLREFWRVVPQVRAEAGCIEYGPTVDIETDIAPQIPFRGDVVTIIERWVDLDSLKAHLSASHMIDYRPRVKPFVRRVSLQVLAPVEPSGAT
jgi:quinol monooxygenase YgiN